MPKIIPQTELDAVMRAVAQFPAGASIKDIGAILEVALPRRTLQRRLALLVEKKQLILLGSGRGSRYQLFPEETIVRPDTAEIKISGQTPQVEVYLPVSPEGDTIKEDVRQPIQKRRPAGYKQKFLDDYRPNDTFYLSPETRQGLLDLGCPPGDERPAGTYARHIFDRLLIDLSWNSSRLEGNTYSLLETERLLGLGEIVEGKDARDTQMILNHKAAINLLVDLAIRKPADDYAPLLWASVVRSTTR
jgi:hypothetical protein